jgi:hypothetical protein
MKTLYTLALALLLATTAQAQSHTNPVGEKAMEAEIRKNERWKTFYDSLTVEERKQFLHWWDKELQARPQPNRNDPNKVTTYKREFRQGLQQWYRDEIDTFEQKREMQMRYDELWAKRQQNKTDPVKTKNPDRKNTIRVIDVQGDPRRHNTERPRYYVK